MAFGVPPILEYGSKELQERFLPELLLGMKRICIAITEPEAGSDVANIHTTATKTEDGKFYIVNGAKKWYTDVISEFLGLANIGQDNQWDMVVIRHHGSTYLGPRRIRSLTPRCSPPRPPRRINAPDQGIWTSLFRYNLHRDG